MFLSLCSNLLLEIKTGFLKRWKGLECEEDCAENIEHISFPHCIPMSINKKALMTFTNIRQLNHGNSVSCSKRDTNYSISVSSRDIIYKTPISSRKKDICACNYAQTCTDHHTLGNMLFYTLYSDLKLKFEDWMYNT